MAASPAVVVATTLALAAGFPQVNVLLVDTMGLPATPGAISSVELALMTSWVWLARVPKALAAVSPMSSKICGSQVITGTLTLRNLLAILADATLEEMTTRRLPVASAVA